MQAPLKEISQKEKIAALLIELNKNVTEKDRADFMAEKKITNVTLSHYMNGRVANVDLAMEMLLFFRNKIEEREKLINQ